MVARPVTAISAAGPRRRQPPRPLPPRAFPRRAFPRQPGRLVPPQPPRPSRRSSLGGLGGRFRHDSILSPSRTRSAVGRKDRCRWRHNERAGAGRQAAQDGRCGGTRTRRHGGREPRLVRIEERERVRLLLSLGSPYASIVRTAVGSVDGPDPAAVRSVIRRMSHAFWTPPPETISSPISCVWHSRATTRAVNSVRWRAHRSVRARRIRQVPVEVAGVDSSLPVDFGGGSSW